MDSERVAVRVGVSPRWLAAGFHDLVDVDFSADGFANEVPSLGGVVLPPIPGLGMLEAWLAGDVPHQAMADGAANEAEMRRLRLLTFFPIATALGTSFVYVGARIGTWWPFLLAACFFFLAVLAATASKSHAVTTVLVLPTGIGLANGTWWPFLLASCVFLAALLAMASKYGTMVGDRAFDRMSRKLMGDLRAVTTALVLLTGIGLATATAFVVVSYAAEFPARTMEIVPLGFLVAGTIVGLCVGVLGRARGWEWLYLPGTVAGFFGAVGAAVAYIDVPADVESDSQVRVTRRSIRAHR